MRDSNSETTRTVQRTTWYTLLVLARIANHNNITIDTKYIVPLNRNSRSDSIQPERFKGPKI